MSKPKRWVIGRPTINREPDVTTEPININLYRQPEPGRTTEPIDLRAYRENAAPPPAIPQVEDSPSPTRRGAPRPSLADQLMQNAWVVPIPKPGEPITSIAPTGDDWVALSDLPKEIQGWMRGELAAKGHALAGIKPSMVRDPKQQQLLGQWLKIARMRKDIELEKSERIDPKFRAAMDAARAGAPKKEE